MQCFTSGMDVHPWEDVLGVRFGGSEVWKTYQVSPSYTANGKPVFVQVLGRDILVII